ncbi:hypothetical protein QTP88_005905 [Uroleucon formosanum]
MGNGDGDGLCHPQLHDNYSQVTDDGNGGDGDSDGVEGDGDDSKEHKARNDGDIGRLDDEKLTMRYCRI